jgi:hypothetical protein
MEPTTVGRNRTGTAINPGDISQMLEAVGELSPQVPISTSPIEAERLKFIALADSVGSIPQPASMMKGAMKKGIAMFNGVSPSLFLDKVGERIAFERTGTRLYDALICKYLALSEEGGEELPPLDALPISLEDIDDPVAPRAGEAPLQTLRRIREEEHAHFLMLCEVARQMGADPTAQTPCADVAATATMGVLQVVTDPRTTLAQSLDAMLVAELTDNASWELLAELASKAGQGEVADRFMLALDAEQQHLATVRAWLRMLTVEAFGTNAV